MSREALEGTGHLDAREADDVLREFGLRAQERLWALVKEGAVPAERAQRFLENLNRFTLFSRQAMKHLFKDIENLGAASDVHVGTLARALWRDGISTAATEEYVNALHFYRRNGELIEGLILQTSRGEKGASRNLVRVGGASTVE